MKTFVVTVNDTEYTIRAPDEDNAICTAYRKFHKGKGPASNVFDHIMWHIGTTKEVVTIREVAK